MTHTGKNPSKFLTFVFGLTICLALMFCAAASGAQTARAETATIDTLEVAFEKTEAGNSLAAAFVFEDETAKTLRVPDGANYTATLVFVSKNGQSTTLWEKDNASFPWSRVENQPIERKVAYCIRVRFAPKENYKLSRDGELLKRNMRVTGAELGKGKDIELWDSAGQNYVTTAIEMDFIISRGMTYIGYPRYISPRINEKVSGKIGTEYTDTGIWISGAPGPYTYEARIAPIGMEIQTVNVFGESTCYYQITAKNAMDGGTMYITATAKDGQTCDIPVTIAAVSGGHEHTWVEEIGQIDYEHHGYTKCTDPACPGVAPAFDKGAQRVRHDFYSGCNVKCKTCGDLGNPDAKHKFSAVESEDYAAFHVFRCACGELEKNANGSIKKEKHGGGEQTCLSGAQCDVCGKEYLAATGHKYEFKSFGNGDGTYTHLGFCKYCKEEDTNLRHSPVGGTATCQKKAKCAYEKNGAACGLELGEFLPHNFVDGTCTECSSNKYIKEVLIDVPEFYKGMAYEAMFYPTVIKGNVIDLGINYHIASFSRDGNGYLSGPHNFKTTFITENSVMQYAFRPQTNCVLPENIDDLSVNVTRGEVLSKKIRGGDLVVLVLLRVESVVQSIDIEISQPLAGLLPETITVAEKNGLEVTVNSVSGFLQDGLMTLNQSMQVEVTIKAPEGKTFQTLGKTSIENWLSELNIDGGNLSSYTQSTDLKEITFVFQTKPTIECPHETVVLEAGRPATCTGDGIKDKYVCAGCGAAFFDAARTVPWNDAVAKLPKTGHRFASEYTAEKDVHFFACEICGEKKDEAPHDFGTLAEQINPTCMQNGVKAHYECSACKKLVDADGNETTPEELNIPVNLSNGHKFDAWKDEVPATDAANGEHAHKDCLICNRHFDASDKEMSDFDLIIPKSGTYKVTVNGDNGIYDEGASVTAVAKEPEDGKEFIGWQDANGKIVSTEKTYTFTVNGTTTLTALYGNKTPGKDAVDGETAPAPEGAGLSGGAIAGIVFGALAIVSGGFAIFWFVIRKKTFADLIAAIKGGVWKKQ